MRTEVRAGTTIRIFVSSTFIDMQEERDALLARAFPRLREVAERGGRGLQEVDLRWGITAEEAERGEVIDICLDEVDACRPYFVAVLGRRYGWIDPDAARRLASRHAHLVLFCDRSVTELEIRHAILNPPAHCEPAKGFVYVRDGSEGQAQSRDIEAIGALVRELDASNVAVRRYASPRDLAELVCNDLMPLVTADAVTGASGEDRSATALEQLAFKTLHSATGFQGDAALSRLRRVLWFRRRVVVEGPAGSGKSALLVQLAASSANPALVSIAAAGGRWSRAIGALVQASASGLGRQPFTVSKVDSSFAALERLLARHRGSVMIDAPETSRSSVFGDGREWIPENRPAGRLIVSTCPFRKSYPDVMVMQSRQERDGNNDTGSLN